MVTMVHVNKNKSRRGRPDKPGKRGVLVNEELSQLSPFLAPPDRPGLANQRDHFCLQKILVAIRTRINKKGDPPVS